MTDTTQPSTVSRIAHRLVQFAETVQNRADLGSTEIKDPILTRILDSIGDDIKSLAGRAPLGGSLSPALAAMMLLLVSDVGSSSQTSLDEHNGSTPENVLANDEPEGLIYARVSSNEQAKDGHELEGQIERMEQKAAEMDVSNTYPVTDEGESGKKFDRDGLRRLLRYATLENVEYVFVDELDRLGRRAAQALFITDLLEYELNVTVVTDHGEIKLDTRQGFSETVFNLITAEWNNILKSKRSISGQLQSFQKKNWTGYYNTVPAGYKLEPLDEDDDSESEDNDSESDDDDDEEEKKAWLAKREQDGLEDAITAIFRYFLENQDYGAYQNTKRHIESHYGDLFENGLGNIKRILQNPVYIGKPTAYSDRLDKKVTVEDESLKYIDEELFEKVQEKIERLNGRNVADQVDQTLDIDRLTTIFGLLPVAESSPNIKLHCPDCDEVLDSWEQTTLNWHSGERTVVRYKCKNDDCSREYKKFPNERDMFRIEHFGDLPRDY